MKNQQDRINSLLEFTQHFREWYANHFEDFSSEVNSQLLCLDNEASTLTFEKPVSLGQSDKPAHHATVLP